MYLRLIRGVYPTFTYKRYLYIQIYYKEVTSETSIREFSLEFKSIYLSRKRPQLSQDTPPFFSHITGELICLTLSGRI